MLTEVLGARMFRATIESGRVVSFVTGLLAPSMHLKRCFSIGQAVLGAMHAARLTSASIGRALAQVIDITPKSGIKQLDRLLGNEKFELEAVFRECVPWVVAQRKEVVVTLDWTEFPAHGHSCIATHLVTSHGRATPLVWKTVQTNQLKGRQTNFEREVLSRLASCLPKGVDVVLLADRGFGSVALYEFLRSELGWDFVIRFGANTRVESSSGTLQLAREWVPPGGRILELQDARVTKKRLPVNVVCVKRRAMKDSWCLATTLTGTKNRVVKLYGERFTCEESFRDGKDPRYGMGLSQTRASTPARRDRLLVFAMLATLLLTLLGAAGEEIGCDRALKANTSKKRTHSLFRQGREYLIGCARKHREALRSTFLALLRDHPLQDLTYARI